MYLLKVKLDNPNYSHTQSKVSYQNSYYHKYQIDPKLVVDFSICRKTEDSPKARSEATSLDRLTGQSELLQNR